MKMRVVFAVSLISLTFAGAFTHIYLASDYYYGVQLAVVGGTLLTLVILVITILVLSHYFREKARKTEILEMQATSLAKSRFLARMSHEIRSPLSALLAIPQAQLIKPELQPEVEEAFTRIYKSGTCLLSIVNDILDLSKMEAKKMTLISKKYEVAEVVCEAAQLNLAHAEEKCLKFTVDVDENIPQHLIGDKLRIKQILNNLLSNAIKYTDSGSIALNAFAAATGDSEIANLTISISDTGIGMTDEQISAVFDEYTRFHENGSCEIIGTGLGMSIIIELLELMGGEISIASQVGEGTTVTVVIPQRIYNPAKPNSNTKDETETFETELAKAH